MLNTLRGDGSDCLLTLIFIKMEHPRPLQVCTNICIIFAHTGAGVIRIIKIAEIILFWGSVRLAMTGILEIFILFWDSVYFSNDMSGLILQRFKLFLGQCIG